jgi:hypothetical protein
MNLEDELLRILSSRRSLTRDLELVQSLDLPNWCIAAGYVRNAVWDDLHHYSATTPLNDVDVLYYDTSATEEHEKRYESLLKKHLHEYDWSVKNQARMHLRNGEKQYESVEDAMRRWPETATAVGVTLDKQGLVRVIAPYGLEDLFGLAVRRSPLFSDHEKYRQRVSHKDWLKNWPLLAHIDI